MKNFEILYQDNWLVAIDKPSGFHVHPPECRPEKVPRHKVILHQLRDQIGQRIYPLHRLDVATSGVLLFALNSEAASVYGKLFQAHAVSKIYWAVVRGFSQDQGEVAESLDESAEGTPIPAFTAFRTLQRMQLGEKVGKRNLPARYSWLEVRPQTGRFHQIRRHLNRITHPIVGDTTHGDGHHNRFFRERLKISGLCLRAVHIQLPLYQDKSQVLEISVDQDLHWEKIQKLFDAYRFTKRPE